MILSVQDKKKITTHRINNNLSTTKGFFFQKIWHVLYKTKPFPTIAMKGSSLVFKFKITDMSLLCKSWECVPHCSHLSGFERIGRSNLKRIPVEITHFKCLNFFCKRKIILILIQRPSILYLHKLALTCF